MEIRKVSLDEIVVDLSLNVREKLDEETVERYMECFDRLPEVVGFNTDEGYLLADGFHRVEAANRLGQESIEVEVKQGTRQDAEEYAALANLRHGKPLTRAERRKAVERMLKLHPERANAWIAEDMGVSDHTVKKYREEMESGSQIARVKKFIGKDGKTYPREIKHPKRSEDETPSLDDQPQVDETPTVEPEPQEETTKQPQEVEVTSTETPDTEEEEFSQTYWEKAGYATKEEYDRDYAVLMDDEEEDEEDEADNEEEEPEGIEKPEVKRINWDIFVKYCEDIEEYAFEMGRKENNDRLERIYNSLQMLSYKLETILKDLGYKI